MVQLQMLEEMFKFLGKCRTDILKLQRIKVQKPFSIYISKYW